MKTIQIMGFLLVLSASYGNVNQPATSSSEGAIKQFPPTSTQVPEKNDSAEVQTAIFGAGCFWCVEAVYESLNGVLDVESGYMGGQMKDPDYRSVCSGRTGHAEVVRIRFNSKFISFETLLDWFWRSHDPTTLNRQGADVGTQYRSVVFYENDMQRETAEASKKAAQDSFKDPIVTEISPVAVYYPAEDDHQGYYQANRAAPYCQFVIRPKLKKLELE